MSLVAGALSPRARVVVMRTPGHEPTTVLVEVGPGANVEALREEIRALGGVVLREPGPDGRLLVVRIAAGQLRELAEQRSVVFVDVASEFSTG